MPIRPSRMVRSRSRAAGPSVLRSARAPDDRRRAVALAAFGRKQNAKVGRGTQKIEWRIAGSEKRSNPYSPLTIAHSLHPASRNKKCFSPTWWSWRSGCTRSHSELGRETLQRQWYFVSRRGRVGRCQVCQKHQYLLFMIETFPIRAAVTATRNAKACRSSPGTLMRFRSRFHVLRHHSTPFSAGSCRCQQAHCISQSPTLFLAVCGLCSIGPTG
jgi:hypothetical protein